MNDERIHTEDPTPSMSDREFLSEALSHLAGTLRSVAGTCDEAGGILGSPRGRGPGDEVVLVELEHVADDAINVLTGTKRAIRRLRKVARESSEEIAKMSEPTPPTIPPESLTDAKPSNLLVRVAKSNWTHAGVALAAVGWFLWKWRATGKFPPLDELAATLALWATRIGAIGGAAAGLAAAVKTTSKQVTGNSGELPPETPPTTQD